MPTAIEFDNIGKQYRLGLVSTQTLSHDLHRWWTTNVLRKEDPYLKIGETNDRTVKGESDYVWALRDINFKVEQGDVVGIIGRNGAGKSTLLKLLSRVTAPTTGQIRSRGRIGSLLEVGTGFHPEMTGRENIFMNGAIMGMTRHEIARKLDDIVDFSGCSRYLDTPVKRYSSGMTVRLGFAVAAFLEPEILVVDEVLAVGDAEFQKKAIGKMKDVSQGEGRTVLFVSHNMDSMLNLCTQGVLLDKGTIQYSGTIQNTVTQYLSGGESTTSYKNTKPNSSVYTKDVFFGGTPENEKGMFSLDDEIRIKIAFAKAESAAFDTNTVAGICIQTEQKRMVSITELSLAKLKDLDTLEYELVFPSCRIVPGNYLFHVDIHIPNVCYMDRQDTIWFTIFDNGSEYMKYNGADNGVLIFRPQITSING